MKGVVGAEKKKKLTQLGKEKQEVLLKIIDGKTTSKFETDRWSICTAVEHLRLGREEQGFADKFENL